MHSRYTEKLEKLTIEDKDRAVQYYVDMMLRKSNQMFEYGNLPETIPVKFLEQYLQCDGITAIAQDSDGDYVALIGNYGGDQGKYLGEYRTFTPHCFGKLSQDPKLTSGLEVGKDCEVIWNDSQMQGLLPLFERYAIQLAENDISIMCADVNMRIQSLITADNDDAKNAADEYMKQVRAGKPGIILAQGLMDGISTKPYATAGTTAGITQLIELEQYLKGSLLNELGLDANYNMKRERLSEGETQLNGDMLLPLVDDMLRERQIGIDKVNKLFGLNITVKKASSWKYREEEIEEAAQPEDDQPEEKEEQEDGKSETD